MVKRLTMLFAGFFLMGGVAFAQSQVSGTVTDENGDPVVGAAVRVDGTKTGTVTDINGHFSISASANSNLTISYIGMQDKKVKAGNNLKITMENGDHSLDEVFVVGYGSQKKTSFSGAAANLDASSIKKLQVSNISKALEGAVAGVQTSSASGSPGATSSIRIRGIGSISASQEPLIVLDGVPYDGSLNSIPTQDIENVTVLKDAAANSIFGARGGNGVVMITTKSGSKGKAQVSYDMRLGWNSKGVSDYDIITDPGEYYEMAYEAYRNSLVSEMGYAGASQYAAQNLISNELRYNIYKDVADNAIIDPLTGKINPNAKAQKWNDNWRKDPYRNGFRQEYTASVSAGTDNTKVYASIGYLGDEGYLAGSDFSRYNGRVKFDQNLGKHVRIGANIGYSRTNRSTFNNGSSDSGFSNQFFFGQTIAPIYPIYLYDADGNRQYDEKGQVLYDWGDTTGRPYASSANPYASAKLNTFQNKIDNVTSRGYFEYSFLNDFKFTTNLAYDVSNVISKTYMNPVGGDAKSVNGRGYQSSQRVGNLDIQELLEWNHSFGDHNIDVLLGHENEKEDTYYLYGHMTNFANPDIIDFANATTYQNLTSYTGKITHEGYFARANYDYAEKYYLTASIRRDGSSIFSKDNRWGTFWAVGASWRLNEESWLKDNKTINNLKLKASYGTQGNDDITSALGYNYAYSDVYSVDRVSGNAAFTKVIRAAKDLTWEKNYNFNLGVELGMWNRLNAEFDFFIKKTKDMIYASPLAPSEGSPNSQWTNDIDMKNTGIEFTLSGDIIKTKDFTWNASLNLTHYVNKLTKLPANKDPRGYANGTYWRKIGGSLYRFYLYQYAGVDANTGQPLYWHSDYSYYDKQGNEITETEANALGWQNYDRVETKKYKVAGSANATQYDTEKNAIPDITGGFTTSATWKGFDLSVATAFQLGGWVDDSFYSTLMTSGSRGQNFHKDMFNRWTPAHTATNIPALYMDGNNTSIDGNSDFFLTKASYFSLRNVTFGYTLPRSILAPIGLQNLRVYFSGDNIWLTSKRKGLDPRQSFSGATAYVYSALSSYSFGLSLTF